MRATMSGHYWMGNSEGSECGEGFYSHAVKVGHTPACISFEKYVGRARLLCGLKWSKLPHDYVSVRGSLGKAKP